MQSEGFYPADFDNLEDLNYLEESDNLKELDYPED